MIIINRLKTKNVCIGIITANCGFKFAPAVELNANEKTLLK